MKLRQRRKAYQGRFFVLPWVQEPLHMWYIHPGFWPKPYAHRQVNSKRLYPRAYSDPWRETPKG